VRRHRRQAADAIVVLGCPPSTALRRRLDRGIQLLREGAAPLLVLTGGGAGPVAEAEIMRDAALARGVPPAALLIEPRSRNTYENARETAVLLGSRGLRSVLLVSDRLHLPRAMIMFYLAGLHIAGCAGVAPPSIIWEARVAIHESAALPASLSRALFTRIGASRLRRREWRFRSAGKSREC
jgi:uncharacterized SAM-binding protein YcdF (DUF218 family)